MMSDQRSFATTSLSLGDGKRLEDGGVSASRRSAIEGAFRTSTRLDGWASEDARILGLLVSFLSPFHQLTHEFLHRGGSPRKRWALDGSITEVGATTTSLSPELTRLLSDSARLSHALDDLSTAFLKKSNQAYFLNDQAVSRIHQDLSTNALLFWKTQALIVAYRASSWKYIEPSNFDVSSILPHLQFAAQNHKDCFKNLSADTRADFILTLLEASRFPTIVWKRFAVAEAAANMRSLNHSQTEIWHLSSCLSSTQAMLRRLDGEHPAAVKILDTFLRQQQPNTLTHRANAAIGQVTLQRALNCLQVNDLPQAKQLLEAWSPLDKQPSLMEQVVQFRKDMTLGRTLRIQGMFSEAHTHLKWSYDLIDQLRDLTFDDDRRDLTVEMADTLRELDKPQAAEEYLRKELARRVVDKQEVPASGKSLLESSLAEVLFAQGRIEEAERLCIETEARADNLMKLGKLRVCIVLAKIYHTRSDHKRALRYWNEAMKQVVRFPGATGRTTRTILLSKQESMRSMGFVDAQDQSVKHAATSDVLQSGGMIYWIAGMRHWQDYLDSETTRSRM
ncbi:hypothetical protein N8I77_010225 [Diaporthe amygdali]|nr:hypothetical protein N8I77_010225 [Diaporthe amygdali]